MSDSNAPNLDAERRALKRSANLMLRRHRALGLPIVTGDEGRVVHLDPETMKEIPPSEVADFVARAQASWDE
jgi:hypothetical protein